MAIVLSAKSKAITGGAVGVTCLLSALMFCNLYGWNGGGPASLPQDAAGRPVDRADGEDKYAKDNWDPKSLHLYQKVDVLMMLFARVEIRT